MTSWFDAIHTCDEHAENIIHKLLDDKRSVNEADPATGDSPLQRAIRQGNYKLINLFLDHHVNIHHRNKRDSDALYCVTFKRHSSNMTTEQYLDVFRRLLVAGADLNFQNGSHPSVFLRIVYCTAHSEYCTTYKDSSRGCIHLHDNFFRSAFEICLGHAPNVNQEAPCGNTSVHLAAKGQAVKLLRRLVAMGGNINLKGRHGATPLQSALWTTKDDLSCVQYLLEQGALVNNICRFGRQQSLNEIHLLLFCNPTSNLQLLSLLLSHGVNVNWKNRTGCTALHRIVKLRREHRRAEHFQAIETLVHAGLNLHERNDKMDTALDCAIKRNDAYMMVALMKQGAWVTDLRTGTRKKYPKWSEKIRAMSVLLTLCSARGRLGSQCFCRKVPIDQWRRLKLFFPL